MSTNLSSKRLTFEFALVQGLLWICFPTGVAFATNHMLGLGLTSLHSGVMLALANISSLILQPFLAARSDEDARFSSARILAALSAVVFVTNLIQCIFPRSAPVALICGTLAAIALLSSSPFSISLKYEMAEDEAIPFGPCRAVGSIFYAIGVALMGRLIERFGIIVLPILACVFSALLFALVLAIGARTQGTARRSTSKTDSAEEGSRSMLSFLAERPQLFALVVGVSCLFFAHNLYNNFTINIVAELGGADADMGFIVGLAAALELPTMFFYERLSKRFGQVRLLTISLVMFVAKAVATLLAWNIPVLTMAYATQILAFALFTPASVDFAASTFSEDDTVKAQTAFTMAQIAGAIFASLLGSVLIVSLGVKAALVVCAFVSLAGLLISLRAMRKF